MKIISAGGTDKGRTRKNNEDAFLVEDTLRLYAVADGIGGHEGGEVASRMAIETLREIIGNRVPQGSGRARDIAVSLTDAFKSANTRLLETGSRDFRLSGMGTTLTTVLFSGETAHLAHAGDSRAYLLRAGALEQLTADHGLVAEQVRAGLITPEQARRSPYRHVITRALGIESDLAPDILEVEIRTGDLLLLCTDGLTEMIEDPGIGRILLKSPSPESAVEKLIAAANDRGGVDNITVIVLKIES